MFINTQYPTFVVENDLVGGVAQGIIFSKTECENIIKFCSKYPVEDATVHSSDPTKATNHSIRKNFIHWIHNSPQSEPLFKKILTVCVDANKKFWKMDLHGFLEPIQFTHYKGGGDHYSWHLDLSTKNLSKRKLSVSIQLSDPDTYEGGDLELQGLGRTVANKAQGNLVAFPSWMGHRETPVTAGERYSLVVWLAGPPFR